MKRCYLVVVILMGMLVSILEAFHGGHGYGGITKVGCK